MLYDALRNILPHSPVQVNPQKEIRSKKITIKKAAALLPQLF